jgi:hypothetical protein
VRERAGADRQFQETTFLEQHGIRLEGTKPKGKKAQRTSENFSRGGFTRRKGWYRTNDIRTTASPRSGHGDLGSEIGEELLFGEYRTDMGGVAKRRPEG